MEKTRNMTVSPALLAIVIGSIFLVSGCIQTPQQGGPQVSAPSGGGSCDAGSWIKTGGFEYRVTGVETHTIAGKTVQTCCTEKIMQNQKSKVCAGMDSDSYSIVWLTDEETGQLYKAAEMYPQGDKTCQITYDPSGEKISEMCV